MLVPTIVTSCCMHQSGHGIACPILREDNEPITSLLVVGDCPRLMRKEQSEFRISAAYNRLTIGRYGFYRINDAKKRPLFENFRTGDVFE